MAISNQDDLFQRAAPDCPMCEESIRNTEIHWYQTDEGEWAILFAAMVCPNNHRISVYDA